MYTRTQCYLNASGTFFFIYIQKGNVCTLWGQNKGEISRKGVLFKNFDAAVLCKSVWMLLYKKKGMSVNLCEGKKR